MLEHHRRLLPAAEALAGHLQPPTPQVKPGTTTAFVPDEWEIQRRADGMVQRQMVKMNGYHHHVNGSGPDLPDWHPERDV